MIIYIIIYKGQRWGSALPGSFLQKEQLNKDFQSDLIYANIEGCVYEKKLPDLNVNSNENNDKKNYLYDDKLRLFYAGDFCSTRIPGIFIMHMYICVNMYMYLYVCMYIYMHVCIYTCMYV
jgi:hypothetical protein